VIAREGYAIIAAVAVLAVVLAAAGWAWGGWVRWPAVGLGLGLLAFTLYFFRDPERTPPPNADRLLLAPADGRVVEVVDEPDPIYLDGPAQRVSIFLSPLDVHVNRVPSAGTVEHVRYRPGDYLVAWHPKASEKNERSEIGVRRPDGTRVLFKQIAGAVARRIEYHLAEGDTVQAGDRFGIVKFGSRMDVLVPPHVTLDVDEGDVVRAGESVLGRFSGPDADAQASAAGARPAATNASATSSSHPPSGS
jgi:phosphatidylserine decarboxylase